MAKNITLLGASYTDVPGVTLPQTGGGTATFYDVSDTTAISANVLYGKTFYDASGSATLGLMQNNGTITATIDGLTTTVYLLPSGYSAGGSVSLTSDIENALAAI